MLPLVAAHLVRDSYHLWRRRLAQWSRVGTDVGHDACKSGHLRTVTASATSSAFASTPFVAAAAAVAQPASPSDMR